VPSVPKEDKVAQIVGWHITRDIPCKMCDKPATVMLADDNDIMDYDDVCNDHITKGSKDPIMDVFLKALLKTDE